MFNDDETVSHKVNALVPFGATQATTASSANQQIREIMRAMLERDHDENDDVVWDAISPHLVPEGIAGSIQFDHACVAMKVKEACPSLSGFANLKLFGIWKLFESVLRTRGYDMSKGHVIGFNLQLADKSPQANQSS